ncbi:prolyl-tRNA synthetase associated domain-containing protein [Spartinivicinus ruber]|uniref:prolyl-tRNA synthetase associated domain-containing protein n=1 Tax=Spartinivicinus ruber TaxID=2683272 RepID=UPI0013D88742|nr:prolyl-tRNA synthetase associated domain-containing protein [Spartinivicinus ruber]
MDIYSFLVEQHVRFEQYDHPPLYSCEDANRLTSHIPGAKTKNSFLRDRKGKRHFLLVVSDDKTISLEKLATQLAVNKLSLASPERLKKYLGIKPGAVSLLSLVHDPCHVVEVLIDETIWAYPTIQCHPLVNTVTLVIPKQDIEKFMHATGHKLKLIHICE